MKLKKLFIIATLSLFASMGTAFGQGATVIKQFGCVITAADSGLPIMLFTNKTHSVQTPSGKTVLKCFFDIPSIHVPSSTMRHNGFLCNTHLGLTNDSQSVTTRGGKVVLTCKI